MRSSGSIFSDASVKPAMSEKNTVSLRRRLASMTSLWPLKID